MQVVPSDYPRTWLCFTETMEVLDINEEGTIEMGYRRLLECTKSGQPHDNIRNWKESQLLEKLLNKQQTVLLSHPHAIGG